MDALANQKCKFMSILAWSWDTNCPRPIVIQMAQLVGEALEVVRLQARAVMNDVTVGWRDSALSDRLADQEEVVPFWTSDNCVHNSSRWRVGVLSTSCMK